MRRSSLGSTAAGCARALRSIGNLNHLFSARSYIAELASVSIVGEFRESFVKIPVLLRLAWAAQRSETREVCRIAPLARTQSERRRRLALATGFRLLRLSGINRIAAPVRVAGRGSAGPDGLRILTITGGSSMPVLSVSKGRR